MVKITPNDIIEAFIAGAAAVIALYVGVNTFNISNPTYIILFTSTTGFIVRRVLMSAMGRG